MSAPNGRRPSNVPGEARSFVTAVVFLAVVVVAAAATMVSDDSVGIGDPVPLVALAFASLLTVRYPVLLRTGTGERQAVTFDEATVVAALLILPAPVVPVLLMLTTVFAYVGARQPGMLKIAFNAASSAVCASVAVGLHTLVTRSILPTMPAGTVDLLGAALGGIGFTVSSLVLISGLFDRLEVRTRRETLAAFVPLYRFALPANLLIGLLVGLAAQTIPAAAAIMGGLVMALHFAFRGVGALADEARHADTLHGAAAAIEDITTVREQLPVFLGELRRTFDGTTAVIGTIDPTGATDWLAIDRLGDPDPPAPETVNLVEALRGGPPVQDSRSVPDAPWADHVDALLMERAVEGRRVVAAVLDHRGARGWSDRDAALLEILVQQVAAAIRNEELFRSVIEERARYAEESRKLNEILTAASDGIVLVDADGVIVTWNPAMEAQTGTPAEQAVGRRWVDVVEVRGPDDQPLPEGPEALRQALSGTATTMATELKLRRGSEWRRARITFAPVMRSGAVVGEVAVARDVTAEHEIDLLKADFVAIVSHELRTPLTPLKGFVETLQQRAAELRHEQVSGIADAMSRQVARMEAMVSDLLVIADLEREAVELTVEPVAVGELVRAAILAETMMGGRDRIDVSELDGAWVQADVTAGTRVLRALLNNALKHTEGSVRLASTQRDGMVEIRVADEGPGIPAWEQETIFERFRRIGDHLSWSTQGPGLGLAIARGLADRMGGTVTVESELGAGATFVVTLRAATAPQGHSNTPLPSAEHAPDPR